MFKQIFEYIQIFEYFPPNIDISLRFVVIFKAEYYLNKIIKIRGNAGIKEVLFSFFT